MSNIKKILLNQFMESSIEEQFDIHSIVDHVEAKSLKKLIFQCPNEMLPQIFQIKQMVLKRLPSISISVLCDKHVFLTFIKFIFIF